MWKYFIVVGAIIIVIVIAVVLIIHYSKNNILDGPGMVNSYTQISQDEAKEMMKLDDGHIIVDVRRQDEYDSGHIPGANVKPYVPKRNGSRTQVFGYKRYALRDGRNYGE